MSMSAGANVVSVATPTRSRKSRFLDDTRRVRRKEESAAARLFERQPDELRAEEIAGLVGAHREIVKDPLAASHARCRDVIENALGGARGEIGVAIAIEHRAGMMS